MFRNKRQHSSFELEQGEVLWNRTCMIHWFCKNVALVQLPDLTVVHLMPLLEENKDVSAEVKI